METDGDIGDFALRADTIKIVKKAVVTGDVAYNELDNKGTIIGTEVSPQDLPVFEPSELPPFVAGSSNANDIVVPKNGTQILAFGTYGDIVVGKGATLILDGLYQVRSILVNKKGEILFDGESEVTVVETLKTKSKATIGPQSGSGIEAKDIIFYVAGGNNGKAANIGSKNTLSATIFAPNGDIIVGSKSVVIGALFGKTVELKSKVSVTRDSAFSNAPPVAQDDDFNVLEDGVLNGDVLADNGAKQNPEDMEVRGLATSSRFQDFPPWDNGGTPGIGSGLK